MTHKLLLTIAAIGTTLVGIAQNTNDSIPEKKTTFQKTMNNLSGNFESNIQWYNDDSTLGDFSEDGKDPLGEHHLRANSYLNLDYNFLENFTVGLQVESYAPMSLLNYHESYDDTNIAQYYAKYQNNKINLSVTAGYFYEQFGSGLLLRSYEDRQLGTNNALRGGKIAYAPIKSIQLKAIYGQQRAGLDEFPKQAVTDAVVFGADTTFDLAEAFKLENITTLSLGASYVGKKEDAPLDNTVDNYPEQIDSYALRLDVDFGKFYINGEYNLKGEDVAYKSLSGQQFLIEDRYFKGNALLATVGYTKKGLGISGTFRRLENMSFYTERQYNKPGSNLYNLSSMNYIPSLTKQHDYSLTNIYVYNAQPGLSIANYLGQAGEIGGQFDVFYRFKRKTALGGKYGMKLTANLSYWAFLETTFDADNNNYETEFLSFGTKLFRDFNFEVRKKLSSKLKMIATYVNVVIDSGMAHGSPPTSSIDTNFDIKYISSNIAIIEGTYKLKKGRSFRLEGQHMWSDDIEKGNWAGGTIEYNLTKKIGLYATDMWNYGNEIDDEQVHYYNFGGSYTTSYKKGAFRAAVNYGRQRAGLVCVGGVCRQVPQNTGLTVNLAASF